MRIIIMFFFIMCPFQVDTCQQGQLPPYDMSVKSFPKNIVLYARMYQMSEKQVSEKLHNEFPLAPERTDVILNVATQAGNKKEVEEILAATSNISVQALRTALLFAHEECNYPGSQNFQPIGQRLVLVDILRNRLLSDLNDRENKTF